MPFDGTSNRVSDTLRAARAKIEHPEHWVKGTFRNEAGTAFCARGAICALDINWFDAVIATDALNAVARMRGWLSIEWINDAPDTSHADILAVFDEAIAAADAA